MVGIVGSSLRINNTLVNDEGRRLLP